MSTQLSRGLLRHYGESWQRTLCATTTLNVEAVENYVYAIYRSLGYTRQPVIIRADSPVLAFMLFAVLFKASHRFESCGPALLNPVGYSLFKGDWAAEYTETTYRFILKKRITPFGRFRIRYEELMDRTARQILKAYNGDQIGECVAYFREIGIRNDLQARLAVGNSRYWQERGVRPANNIRELVFGQMRHEYHAAWPNDFIPFKLRSILNALDEILSKKKEKDQPNKDQFAGYSLPAFKKAHHVARLFFEKHGLNNYNFCKLLWNFHFEECSHEGFLNQVETIFLANIGFGRQDADYYAPLACLTDCAELPCRTDLAPFIALSRSCGWWLPMRDYVVICDNPAEIHLDQGRLHRDGGPAMSYPDGFAVWALNGVRVPREIAESSSHNLDPRLILKEHNAEVRREIIRKIGIERVCEKLGAQVIDSAADYELLILDLGDKVRRPFLKMKNPSIGVYHIEGVAPEITTVEEALLWRNGTPEKPIALT
jgi:hypothetical protein